MAPPAISTSSWSPARIRSWVFRIPLLTRVILLIILLLWVLELQSAWNVVEWGGLIPSKVGLQTMHRLNTYPLIHLGFLHMLLNAIALAPLLERFEAEHGTLVTAALFGGPLSTLPGGLYILIERVILRRDYAVQGASIWVFLLLGHEAIKTWKKNPWFSLGSNRIPTWISPLLPLIAVTAFVPGTSFLGHVCGLAVGYVYGLGYLRILAPPEKILRWVEAKLNLLGRLPHYVSVDQKTYGRYGVLPTPNSANGVSDSGVPMTFMGTGASGQRLGGS